MVIVYLKINRVQVGNIVDLQTQPEIEILRDRRVQRGQFQKRHHRGKCDFDNHLSGRVNIRDSHAPVDHDSAYIHRFHHKPPLGADRDLYGCFQIAADELEPGTYGFHVASGDCKYEPVELLDIPDIGQVGADMYLSVMIVLLVDNLLRTSGDKQSCKHQQDYAKQVSLTHRLTPLLDIRSPPVSAGRDTIIR